MKGTLGRIASVSLLLTVFASELFAAPKYTITDLGAGVIPAAINKDGAIVGTVVSTDSGPQAFIYRNGIVAGLGQLGGTASWGLGINDSATIVGTICMDELCKQNPYWGLQRHGFVAKDGQVTDLMSAAGMLEGLRINNPGQILGRNFIDGWVKIILYGSSDAKITDVSQSLGKNTSLWPRGLNNLGEAVFIDSYCGSFECSNSYLFSGGILQALPGDQFYAWDVADINDARQIVGTTGMYHRGLLYTEDLTILRDDNLLAFAPLAINNEGVMLGSARDLRTFGVVFSKRPVWLSHKPAPDSIWNPAIYVKKNVIVLQEQLVGTTDQWVLEEVFDINDNGQIIGYGRKNSENEHGFVLTPASMEGHRK